jgi:hypothetical protein
VAQDSLSVANGTGVAVRQAFNTAMQASATNQSGSSAPSTTYPFQFFADTNTNTLKLRNAANNAYINVSGVGQIGADNLGLLPKTGGTISGNLIVSGTLTVQGTTTTVSSTTITVTDKNIEIGKVSTPTDTTADGGGLTLRGATDKTWNWVDATDSWTSSENIDLASGKVLKANGTQILSATNFTGTSANATNVTVADESSDTSCNVLFTTAATGNLPPKTGTNLTFNSSSGALTATSFNGDLVGSIPDDSVTSAKIVDGTIVNADINASAAIAGTKISPNFGSQAITTTGNLSAAVGTFTDASGSDPTMQINHSDADVTGEFIRVGRTDLPTIRYHSIKAKHSGGASGNTLSFNIHDSSSLTSQTEVLTLLGNGNVGIGTTSPIELLHANGAIISVGSSSTSGTTGAKRALFDLSGNQCRLGHFRGAVSSGSGSLGLYTESTEKVRIDTSGNVGIGTTSPTSLLHIRTASVALASNGHLQIQSTDAGADIGGQLNFGNDNARRCAIAGRQESSDAIAGYLQFGTRGTSGDITERMRIDSSGNVGIGTTSPSAKLDVNGDATINDIRVGKGANSVAGNTVLGENALDAAVTGANNTAVGLQSLSANTSGADNTAVGRFALNVNTTGSDNTAVGKNALDSNTTASSNTAIGNNALTANTTGGNNVAVGNNALDANTTASSNIAIGHAALTDNTTGAQNVAVGRATLGANTTASNNTGIGHNALLSNTTGESNVALGKSAGDTITTGNQNTIIGTSADVDSATRVGACSLGFNVSTHSADTSFRVVGVGGVYNTGNTSSWNTTSDRRIKKNIVDSKIGLAEINQIKVRNFEYRTPDEITDSALQGYDLKQLAVAKSGIQVGCIAQELETIIPSAVVEDKRGVKNVQPDELTWHLIKAIQELSEKVKALETG